MKLPKPFAPCIVTWEDCYAQAAAQFNSPSDMLRSYKPLLRKTVGFYAGKVTKDGREAYIIATDDDRSQDDPQAIGGAIYIPAAMVVDCKPLYEQPIKRK